MEIALVCTDLPSSDFLCVAVLLFVWTSYASMLFDCMSNKANGKKWLHVLLPLNSGIMFVLALDLQIVWMQKKKDSVKEGLSKKNMMSESELMLEKLDGQPAAS